MIWSRLRQGDNEGFQRAGHEMSFSRNQQEDDDLNSMQDYLKENEKTFLLIVPGGFNSQAAPCKLFDMDDVL